MLANLNRGAERTCFRVADLFEQIDDPYRGLRRVTRARGGHGADGEESEQAAALDLTAGRAGEWP